MATFRGLLEVEGDPMSNVVADVAVSGSELRLSSAGSEIGTWALNDVTIEESEGAFRIVAEGESLILRLNDAKRFASAVGLWLSPTFEDDLTPVVIPKPPTLSPSPIPAVEPPESAEPSDVAEPPDTAESSDSPEPPDTAGSSDSPEPAATAEPAPEPADLGFAEEDASSIEEAGDGGEPLTRQLSWALAGAAALLFLGAVLDWGSFRLTNTNFPIARVLIVVAAFAGVAASYLGFAQEKRRDVTVVAALSGLISVLVLLLYARRAGIGYGFIVTILGTVAMITIIALVLSDFGSEQSDDPAR